MILNKLKQAYYLKDSVKDRFLLAVYFGLFVFLFLLIFQPFGISNLKYNFTYITLGYGVVTFITMLIINIAIPPLLKNYFVEEKWNVGREITWSLVNIAAIGLANTYYSSLIGITSFTILNILMFEFYTLIIGVFPVSIGILIDEAKLRKRYSRSSESINKELQASDNIIDSSNEKLAIPSDNKNEELIINENQLLYISSADNYIEVYYLESGKVNKKLLRNSLKALESEFKDHPNIFRCHKSYIVNLDKIKSVSGNAQGLKLSIEDVERKIPVSRKLNDTIKDRLSSHH